ncbi:hypothetical protein [Bradyrhizobium sp. AUGA SZCCT0182]|uniref:hypothetical protein n=1 Tax=Bradyrhizobium sp. AUGA SZCCT0182 TaxID=2807667 RepID=UPI001BA76F05|nr:hypothetical protein [Bradyrhizobium sp. AUGA SZCCT0182]MBR1232101.1 hypothetical protein [Bradyrhizobium sp. AUGA SZCCT0182]
MTSTTRFGWIRLPLLVAGFSLGAVLAVAAQTPPADEDTEEPAEEAAPDVAAAPGVAVAPDVNDPDIMKDIDVSKLDWSQLDLDAAPLTGPAAKTRAASKAATSTDTAWSANEKANGSSAVSVKQSLTPFWDARIGADMTVARQGTLTAQELLSEKLANGGSLPQSSGTAWAAITAPGVGSIWDKTSVEARVDPGADQSRLGTSLSKSLPLNEQYSLTLQNGYNLIQQGIVPVPGIISHPTRSYETDQSARLSIADTGTSFVAGQTLSTSDDKWLRKVGAEQKLFDGVTISGSVGETPSGVVNKSFGAGFKRSW